jgi:hypothetical protein
VGDLVVCAPVVPTRETALREHLLGLGRSPLARLPLATHFARWVIVPLDGPRLVFSSRFDGKVDTYLDGLVRLDEAGTIWSHCEGLEDPADLRAYLERHRLKSPYILSAWPKASVAEINAALDRRTALSRFAVEAQGLDPVGLVHAFRERFVR